MNWRKLLWGAWGGAHRAGAKSTVGTIGDAGEQAAARWLRQNGYRIRARNLRIGRDEADIIAIDPDGQTVVVVEVKTRADQNALPEERIDKRKQYRLARLAASLQKQHAYRNRPIRFDVLAVNLPSNDAESNIRHIPSAFDAPF